MINRLFNVSLQTKITGLLLGVIISVIFILSIFFAYSTVEQILSNKYRLSMQTARTVSLLPSVSESLQEGDGRASLQFLTDQFSMENDADFIIIQDKEGRVLTHPNEEYLGRVQAFGDGFKARVFGGYYNMESDEFLAPSIVGIAPILSETGSVLGVTTVGYLKKDIASLIYERIRFILYLSVAVIIIGIVLGYLLARHIRKETFGYEPREIAALYSRQDTLLSSLNEGVVAADEHDKITLINTSAKDLLEVNDSYIHRPIYELLPPLEYSWVYETKDEKLNQEIYLNNKSLFVNLVPMFTQGEFTGLVATIKDRTEITEMINTLSEVKKYSDDLRAQNHEHSNKMHLISGMLQLGNYNQVLELIDREMNHIQKNNRSIFNQIEDTNVQAILIGKMGRASEKKVDFMIDEGSYLSPLPPHIEVAELITIIGNLVDNALEAVISVPHPLVSFSTIDIGNDIIIEVSDNGIGMKEEEQETIFQPGYSTKGDRSKKRGFGLYNVKAAVNKLNGIIEIDSSRQGATITVYIPK
ncbi:sensor histidine kinase [Virgibacillus sp. NKC19-16]|uniref:ATP-binding protein n=1 Tax=Virgibacillus salidurans TaxID=2831673 RepID=UPI001F29D3B7|nr:sensor histidine kinase [Virgibacillus sp. NKC19-16]UJL47661.1 sensor histidine kinase [Virgibacillus sp. NKC19-16]